VGWRLYRRWRKCERLGNRWYGHLLVSMDSRRQLLHPCTSGSAIGIAGSSKNPLARI